MNWVLVSAFVLLTWINQLALMAIEKSTNIKHTKLADG